MITSALINFPGALVSNTDIGAELYRNDADVGSSASGGPSAFVPVYQFLLRGTGTVAVFVRAAAGAAGVGSVGYNYGSVRLTRNGAEVGSPQTLNAATAGSFAEYSWAGVPVLGLGDVFAVELSSSEETDGLTWSPVANAADWVSARARLQLGDSV